MEPAFIFIITFSAEDFSLHVNSLWTHSTGPNTYCMKTSWVIRLPPSPSSSFLSMAPRSCCFQHWFSTVDWVCVCVWFFVHVLNMYMKVFLLLMCSYFCLAHNLPRSKTLFLSAAHQSQGTKRDHGVLEMYLSVWGPTVSKDNSSLLWLCFSCLSINNIISC